MLSHQIFQTVCQIKGVPEIGLFTFHLSHQILTYAAWKLDPQSHATDLFRLNWDHELLNAIQPFLHDSKKKEISEKPQRGNSFTSSEQDSITGASTTVSALQSVS